MEYMESKMQAQYDAGNALYAELEAVTSERDAMAVILAEHQRLHAELNAILHPDGNETAAPSLCDLVSYVRSDRQALVAQVHVLNTAAKYILNSKKRQAKQKAYAALADAVNKTAQQHLRERDAEKGRAGFIAAINWMCSKTTIKAKASTEAAEEYAESIRREK